MVDEERVKEIIKGVVEYNRCYLLSVEFKYHSSNKVYIKVIADSMTGIDLRTLTEITKILRDDVEFNEAVQLDYELEVSSPGVNWPLKERRDFVKHVGRELEIYHFIDSESSPVCGRLVEVDEDGIVLKTKRSGEKHFAYNEIDYGRVVLKW